VAKAVQGRAAHPEAYRLYLEARHLAERYTRDDTAHAVERYNQALELDPDFALAWAWLGYALARQAGAGWAPMEEGLAQGRAALERSLVMQPNLVDALAHLAWFELTHGWDMKAADRAIQRALEIDPGNPLVLHRAGLLASYQGRPEDAIELYKRALERDPLSAGTYHNLGRAYDWVGRYAEGEAALRQAIDLARGRAVTNASLAENLLAQGRAQEALAVAAEEPDDGFRLFTQAMIEHALGRAERSETALQALISSYGQAAAYQIAEIYVTRGDHEAAFQWLERAYEQRDGALTELKHSPRFRALRSDPRWGELIRKVGLG
jgi:tetratricopeptide (TPR) repeat protein